MGEAISPRFPSGNSEEKVGGGAISVDYNVILKEDLRLGAKFLLAKKSPLEILEDAINEGEWFKGIVLSAAFFEHFGGLKLMSHLHEKVSKDKLKHLTLIEIIIFLFGLDLVKQPVYTKMCRVKEKRDDLVHEPFTEIDPDEAKRLILDAIECLKELGVT